jgi:transposase-like protein
MDEKQVRKRWSGEEIVGVLRRYLKEKVELSKLCEEVGCHPSQVFRWEKQLFEGGWKVFDRKPAENHAVRKIEQRAEELEKKLRRKDAVLAELMEEHVALKKTAGDPSGVNGCLTTPATRSLIS